MTLSPSGRRALAQMWANERADRLTHRTAVHQSARIALEARGLIALEARGLIVLDGPHLTLTDTGRTAARELGES